MAEDDRKRRWGPLHTRIQPQNLRNSVQLLVTGNYSFLLSYDHSIVPIVLDAERFPSLKLDSEELLPVSAADHEGKALFSLNPGREEPIPYLDCSGDSFIRKMVDAVLDGLPEPAPLDLKYENSMSEALKTMALEGQGIAWLPYTCTARDLETGGLVPVGNCDHRTQMDIRIFRSSTPTKPSVERLWLLLQEQLGTPK